MDHPNNRAAARLAWTRAALSDNTLTLEPASADASFRSYWRTHHDGQSWIVMDSPPAQEDPRPWLEIGATPGRGRPARARGARQRSGARFPADRRPGHAFVSACVERQQRAMRSMAMRWMHCCACRRAWTTRLAAVRSAMLMQRTGSDAGMVSRQASGPHTRFAMSRRCCKPRSKSCIEERDGTTALFRASRFSQPQPADRRSQQSGRDRFSGRAGWPDDL